jgi:hypothetical protein
LVRAGGLKKQQGTPGKQPTRSGSIGSARFKRKVIRKELVLLALAAASVAALALPATASAIMALHVVPKPEGAKTIHGIGHWTLTAAFGSITCTGTSGSATFENGTTGSLVLTMHGCVEPFGGKCTTPGQPEGTIRTTVLPFHLATVVDTPTGAIGPGVLVTPAGDVATGHFATYICPIIGERKIEGTDLIGTITKPKCSEESSELTISFTSSSSAVQTHRTLAGTNTEYSVHGSSRDFSINITLGQKHKLGCT